MKLGVCVVSSSIRSDLLLAFLGSGARTCLLISLGHVLRRPTHLSLQRQLGLGVNRICLPRCVAVFAAFPLAEFLVVAAVVVPNLAH